MLLPLPQQPLFHGIRENGVQKYVFGGLEIAFALTISRNSTHKKKGEHNVNVSVTLSNSSSPGESRFETFSLVVRKVKDNKEIETRLRLKIKNLGGDLKVKEIMG